MQISISDMTTNLGQIIGFGRVKIPKMFGFDYEVPLLSFVVTEKLDKSYVATCIHLQIDGYGDTVENAQMDMVDNVWYFLWENFNNEKCKDNAWRNILSLFKSNERSNALWDVYHACQIGLAEKGCPTDKYSTLYEKIKELEKEVAKLQEEISKLKGKNNRAENKDERQISPEILQLTIVEYESTGFAA